MHNFKIFLSYFNNLTKIKNESLTALSGPSLRYRPEVQPLKDAFYTTEEFTF